MNNQYRIFNTYHVEYKQDHLQINSWQCYD